MPLGWELWPPRHALCYVTKSRAAWWTLLTLGDNAIIFGFFKLPEVDVRSTPRECSLSGHICPSQGWGINFRALPVLSRAGYLLFHSDLGHLLEGTPPVPLA